MKLDKPNLNAFETKKSPFEISVDISTAWDTASEVDMVLEALKQRGVYRPDLLYRGFDGAKKSVLLREGRENTESEDFYASTESELYADESISALHYALRNDKPVLAIYDSSMLLDEKPEDVTQDLAPYQYLPRESKTYRDALLGIVYIKQ